MGRISRHFAGCLCAHHPEPASAVGEPTDGGGRSPHFNRHWQGCQCARGGLPCADMLMAGFGGRALRWGASPAHPGSREGAICRRLSPGQYSRGRLQAEGGVASPLPSSLGGRARQLLCGARCDDDLHRHIAEDNAMRRRTGATTDRTTTISSIEFSSAEEAANDELEDGGSRRRGAA